MGNPALYRTALIDWLACAHNGAQQPAAKAAGRVGEALNDQIVSAATAGHVLDFDDTYLPGLCHLSAATAPVAIVFGTWLGRTVAEVLRAYAAGFEAMAAVSAASHPHLYAGGWHPTAVCGTVGAAVTAAELLNLDAGSSDTACNLALLGAGGFRAAFGSDGKSLQVGLAAASGLQAARLAAAGATVPDRVRTGKWGMQSVFGATWAAPNPAKPAITQNWLKRYPCCLQTHGAIEAAVGAKEQHATASGRGTVTVHPISCDAATMGPDVKTGLEAKFSISYCTALGIIGGHPALSDFHSVDDSVRNLARRIEVRKDASLLESEAQLRWEEPDGRIIRTGTTAAVGSPGKPMGDEGLRSKLVALEAEHLPRLFADADAPASLLSSALG